MNRFWRLLGLSGATRHEVEQAQEENIDFNVAAHSASTKLILNHIRDHGQTNDRLNQSAKQLKSSAFGDLEDSIRGGGRKE